MLLRISGLATCKFRPVVDPVDWSQLLAFNLAAGNFFDLHALDGRNISGTSPAFDDDPLVHCCLADAQSRCKCTLTAENFGGTFDCIDTGICHGAA